MFFGTPNLAPNGAKLGVVITNKTIRNNSEKKVAKNILRSGPGSRPIRVWQNQRIKLQMNIKWEKKSQPFKTKGNTSETVFLLNPHGPSHVMTPGAF